MALGFVWLAIVVFAASNTIVQLLASLGSYHTIDGRNPISFCNVLFVGNLCALLVLSVIHHRQWTRANCGALTRSDWGWLIVLALLSGALVPSLAFLALENTSVANVVMLGRIEPALFLLLAVLFLGERTTHWAAAGTALALLGGILTVGLRGEIADISLGVGEWQAIAAAVISAASTAISKARIKHIPLGIFTVFRTGVGTVVFYIVAAYLFGPMHFVDVFSPFLWKWMLVYGAVVVALGQWCWFLGLRQVQGSDISLATSASPLFGVLIAFFVLGELPDMALAVGVGFILLGIAVSEGGRRLWGRRARDARVAGPEAVELEARVNFKGV